MKNWYKPLRVYNVIKEESIPFFCCETEEVRELESDFVEAIELLIYTLDCLENNVNICTSELYDAVEKAYGKSWEEIKEELE